MRCISHRVRLAVQCLPALLACLIAGCLAGGGRASPAPGRPCLGETPRIPTAGIASFFGQKEWDSILARRYEGYLIFQAVAREDGTLRLGRIAEAFPDAGREAQARELCSGLHVSSISVGSHGSALVEVYVVFYDYGRGLREALIFAQQQEMVAPTGTDKTVNYLGTKHW